MLKYDSEIENGDRNVLYYDDQDLDVQWYSRQCNRFLRKISVPDFANEFEEVQAKQLLNKPYPGNYQQ